MAGYYSAAPGLNPPILRARGSVRSEGGESPREDGSEGLVDRNEEDSQREALSTQGLKEENAAPFGLGMLSPGWQSAMAGF